MKVSKRFNAFALILALAIMVFSSGMKVSAFTKTQYGLTMKGDNSISKTKGSAWGSVSPQSYISLASVYKYKNSSGKTKTVPTDLTGAGGSTGASWSYKLPSGSVSKSINTNWLGIYKGHKVPKEMTTVY